MASELEITNEENKSNDKEVNSPNAARKEGGSKKHRQRKKKHFNTIRELLEFYFGDANLSKDRFLMQKINDDPYVPLDVFLTFNKMKALTNSVEEIAKSVLNSEMLELDEDKKKVRRKTVIPRERDVDHKTLYVESLPPTADHEWVTEVFSRFGKVVYVSLPKYAKSHKIKEFGFIEFEEESAIQKAVTSFCEFNGVLNIQETDPAELKSVQSFLKEQKAKENMLEGTCEQSSNNKRKNKKRKNSNDEPDPKRAKICDGEILTEEKTSTLVVKAENIADSSEIQPSDEKAKKKRIRKKKSKGPSDLTSSEAPFFEMKILPKKEWKRLRNKYLNLQREKIAEIKRSAWKEQHINNGNFSSGTNETLAKKPVNKKFQKMNMNFYGAGSENDATGNDIHKETDIVKDKSDKNPALNKPPLFTYKPGLIIEIDFLEPCVNVKEFKTEMRQYEHVKYVDVREGSMQAHLRFESSERAEDFSKQISCAEYNCKILSGELESEYWNKIKLDREAKLTKKVKVPLKRGREKVKKIIAKHIHFDDEDGGTDLRSLN